MKAKIFIASLVLSVFPAFAETFEEAIERLPPEKESGFWGSFDDVLSRTNNFLGNINDALENFNKGKYGDMVSSFKGSVDAFVKHREEHAKALAAEVVAAEARLTKSGSRADRLALADACRRAGDFDKCLVTLQPVIPSGKLDDVADIKGAYEVFEALYACYYDSYRNDGLQSAVEAVEVLAAKPGATAAMKLGAALMQQRYYARIGDLRTAQNQAMALAKEYLALSDKDRETCTAFAPEIIFDNCSYAHLFGEYDTTLEILDDNPVWPDPVRNARQLLLLAEARAHKGKMPEAFNALYKAGDIIHKAYPDGSDIEMDYLIMAGDLVRLNSARDKGAQSFNKFTDKGLLYYINGARMLARNIWGDNNPYIRRVNRRVALAAVLDYKNKDEQSKRYTAPSTVKTLAVIAGKDKYTFQEQQYIDIHDAAQKSLKLARKVYGEEMDFMRRRLHDDFATMSEGQRAEYIAHMSELVNDIYNFAETDTDKDAAAMVYDACLFSKSMLMSYSRSVSKLVRKLGDPALTATHSRLTDMRRRLVALEQGGDYAAATPLRTEVDALERTLLKDLAQKADIGSFMAISYNDVKQKLDKKSTAVEFYSFTDNLYGKPGVRERMVAIRGGKNPEIFTLNYPAGAVNINEQWRLAGLYKQIWEKLVKGYKKGHTIYFAPTGRWNGIPLESLPAGSGVGVNDMFNMVRVSTTRELPQAALADVSSPVLFGGLDYNLSADEAADIRSDLRASGFRGALPSGLWARLPGTAQEVGMIDNALTEASVDHTVISGEEGIEESFKSLSGARHGIIHVATHGYFMPTQGDASAMSQAAVIDEALDNSGLVFAGANRFLVEGSDGRDLDDGHLTAREIALLDLSETDLVVMSACETGAGKYTPEGVLGLQRGFKLAGVNTLVMSLWKVNDAAAATMMGEFYKNMLSGMDKRSAFFKARETLRGGSYPGPDGTTIKGTDPAIGDAFVILD